MYHDSSSRLSTQYSSDSSIPHTLLEVSSKWYKFLYEKAIKHHHPITRVVAVLVKGGSVQSIGVNSSQNNTRVHAEVAALRQVRSAENCKLYVLRVTKSGEVRISKPCVNCLKFIEYKKVKRVFHT